MIFSIRIDAMCSFGSEVIELGGCHSVVQTLNDSHGNFDWINQVV